MMRERAGDMLRDFYLRSHRAIDRIMAGEGASYARARLLMHVARDGPLRAIDIAASFGHAPRTVTEAIDGLERDGLLRRMPDPSDRRAKLISITDAGRVAIEGAESSKQEFVERVFSVLSNDECGEIVRVMGKLNDQLEAMANRPLP